jgi:uncharacterized protein DUF4864
VTSRFKAILLSGALLICAAGTVVTRLWQDQFEAAVKPNELYAVILAQYHACRADDFRQAYQESSRAAQQHLTMVQFESKVRSQYGRIRRPEAIDFGEISLERQRAYVQVYYTNTSRGHEITPALYTLVYERGCWRVENFEIYETWPANRRIAGIRV